MSRWHCHPSQAFLYIRDQISLAWVSLNPRYPTESLLERNFVSPLCWTISSQNCIYVRSLLTGPSKEDVIQSVHWRIVVFLSPLDLSQIASQREWIETGKTVQKYFCLILESGSSHIKASFLEFSTRVYVEKCVLQIQNSEPANTQKHSGQQCVWIQGHQMNALSCLIFDSSKQIYFLFHQLSAQVKC